LAVAFRASLTLYDLWALRMIERADIALRWSRNRGV